MKSNVLGIIILCMTFAEINSQTVSVGTCAQVPVNTKFNLSAVIIFVISIII